MDVESASSGFKILPKTFEINSNRRGSKSAFTGVASPRPPAPLMVEVVFSKKELVVSMLVSHCFIQENARLIKSPLWQFLTLILELILCK